MWIILPDGVLYLWSTNSLSQWPQLKTPHKHASGSSTGFVSLFAYIGAAAAGAPLAWIIQSLHWNGFFGSLFIVSLACALLLVFVYFLQRKKNKLKPNLSI